MTILFVRTIGNSLILAGVFWFCYSFYPVFKAEFFYQVDQARGVERKVIWEIAFGWIATPTVTIALSLGIFKLFQFSGLV